MTRQTDTSAPAPQEPTRGSGGPTEKTSEPKEERGRRFGITDTGSDPEPTPWTGPPPK